MRYFICKKENHEILFEHEGKPEDISWDIPHVIIPAENYKHDEVKILFDGKDYAIQPIEEKVSFLSKLKFW